MVRLNMGLNHVVEVVCPDCGAKHHRGAKEAGCLVLLEECMN